MMLRMQHLQRVARPAFVKRRRRVDWPIVAGPDLPVPRVVNQELRGKLAALLSGFDELLALDNPDAILRHAVELAVQRIGLVRAGILLLDRSRNLMLGTWGTDLHGKIVDEHHIMYAVNDVDREAFRRAVEGHHFTLFENCPIVEHRPDMTIVEGRGWLACTPIRSARTVIGMMFNDAGLSGAPVDPSRQSLAAALCSLLGTILDPVRASSGAGAAALKSDDSPDRQAVAAATALLADDPGISGREISKRLDVSFARLARIFKAEMGMSLVEYRNRARLDRFDVLLQKGHSNLLEAALAAGFGSYAQFHRVFRAIRHTTPSAYMRNRA
jgi:AraC-like DNA-binding protein